MTERNTPRWGTPLRQYAKGRADQHAQSAHPRSAVASVSYKSGRVDGAFDLVEQLLSDVAVDAALDQLDRNGFGMSASEWRLSVEAALAALELPSAHAEGTSG